MKNFLDFLSTTVHQSTENYLDQKTTGVVRCVLGCKTALEINTTQLEQPTLGEKGFNLISTLRVAFAKHTLRLFPSQIITSRQTDWPNDRQYSE